METLDLTKFSNLTKRFAEAGLRLKLTDEPLRRLMGAAGIIQMDIRREVKKGSPFRGEYFVIYPGAPENIIQVRAVDAKLGQVVLMVKEQERTFEEEIPLNVIRRYSHRGGNWLSRLMKDANLSAKDVTYHKGEVVRVRRKVDSGRARYFLMGVDERQLFMCQLPVAATSVAEAHASLKAPTVRFAEGKAEGRTLRQGEWFLCNISPEEKHAIEDGIAKCTLAVHRNASLSRGTTGGKPHIADELVRLPGKPLANGFAVRDAETFVRGRIRHPDHETVRLGEWRKVILNSETRTSAEQARFFGGWVD